MPAHRAASHIFTGTVTGAAGAQKCVCSAGKYLNNYGFGSNTGLRAAAVPQRDARARGETHTAARAVDRYVLVVVPTADPDATHTTVRSDVRVVESAARS